VKRNASEAKSPGVEVGLQYSPTERLTFGGNVNWNDAKYSENVTIGQLNPATGSTGPVVLFRIIQITLVLLALFCATGCQQADPVPQPRAGSAEPAGGSVAESRAGAKDLKDAETFATTEILWDSWGVPHIFAPDAESLFFAHGWAQAKSHGDLLLRLLGESRGRAAEYWGEARLEDDRWVHTMGIPERAAEWYGDQSPRTRSWLDAFARGINTYAAEHPGEISGEVAAVLPVSGTDILAHQQRSLHFTWLARRGALNSAMRQAEVGSNAWAVGPKRSASGRALLLANPHNLWSDQYIWHEAQLKSPEVNIYGAALVGWPFLVIAFNDHLGWTHTVNTHDGADLYRLTHVEGGGYRFDGEVLPFGRREKTLKVKSADGSLREEKLLIRTSVHGPVVGQVDGADVALRVVGLDSPGLFEQYWEMSTATNFQEFEAAQRKMQMPMLTVMYADRDGHILHLFGGQTPVRSSGDWPYWSGVVPGDTSETLWTEVHEYNDLPRVVDPESGWLQNANEPPWTTTLPPALDPDDYPPYMAPRSLSEQGGDRAAQVRFRALRSARLLAEDESITFDELVDYKQSTRMELADRILDDLVIAVDAHGSDLAKRALAVLERWDRATDAESRGAVLFARFVEELTQEGAAGVFAEGPNADRPLTTPDGLADPAAAAGALETAATTVMGEYGTLDVPWGDVYRLRGGDRDLPANGGPGDFGVFPLVKYQKDDDGRFRAWLGESYIALVEFSEPVRARALLTTSNSSQPGSPHNGDQLELFSRKELRPVWRTRAEIEPHLEAREDLGRYVTRGREVR